MLLDYVIERKHMVTGTQVREAMVAANIVQVEHHRCGVCRYMTKYVRDGDLLFFDVGCNCTYSGEQLESRLWDSAAQWINMQSNPDIRSKLARSFGVQEI